MKHLIIILGISLMPLMSIKAQETKSSSGFGIRAGVGVSNIFEHASANSPFSVLKTIPFTYGVSALYDIKVSNLIYIQPSVMFASQSAEYDTNSKLKINMLQIPVMAVAKFPTDKKAQWQVGAGLYLSSGIGGEHSTINAQGKSISEPSFGSTNSLALNKVSGGIKFAGGINIGKIHLGLLHTYGINNSLREQAIEKNKVNGATVSLISTMLNVGFNF